jgi:preprotein translocase subunit SecF
MKRLKVAGLLLLVGVGLSFGIEIEDPYIPAMTGMINSAQQEQTQQEQKTIEHVEEIKQNDDKSKEENIKVKTRKKVKIKKKLSYHKIDN